MKISLNGSWLFKSLTDSQWHDAQVPGCNYLDLLRLGKIPDPFYGMNEKEAYWVALEDWEYKKSFIVDEGLTRSPKIELTCELLDTICEVYINENLAGKGDNAHTRYCFDIKKWIAAGENTIRIVFFSPVKFVEKKQAAEKCPKNWNGLDGIPHIRKPQCHFGWDWGPVLPPSGISGNIHVVFTEEARIVDLEIKQKHKNQRVDLDVTAAVEYFGRAPDCEISVIQPDGRKLLKKRKGSNEITGSLTINDPELWWTNDLSGREEQPLYTVCVELFQDGRPLDRIEKTIGLRTIELNTAEDTYGRNFQFILNGVPLFIKGANWIPADSFINRFDSKKLRHAVNTALFSNLNMLRIWGGGYYESDELYSLCDKAGILVWQDFAFACQPYPFFDTDFLDNVKREVADNVKRLRHHACLALWCGNNEIEAMSAAGSYNKKYVEWTEKFFYRILEPEIRKNDKTTPYIPGSPCGIGHKRGHDRDNVGDTHLWAVWHGLQPMNYYRKRLTRFCSEFGFESLPDIKTIRMFAQPGEYSLKSPVFQSHQKCRSGNEKMVYYIASRFRLPKNFEDFIYLSQVTQQECVKDATEHWRRNKGRCNGSMYWQLNDCWPVCSWASMDYYGNYKALQYTARHFNAPLTVSVEDGRETVKIFVINDKNADAAVTVRFAVFDFEKGVMKAREKTVTVKALSNLHVFDLPVKKLKKEYDAGRTGLIAEMIADGEVLLRKTVLADMEKNLRLPKAAPQKTVCVEKNRLRIQVETDVFARLIRLESSCTAIPFSDNFFDLLPGENTTVYQDLDPACDPAEQAAAVSLSCCTDVEPKANRAADFITRAAVFIKPVNLAGWLYHRKVPKDFRT